MLIRFIEENSFDPELLKNMGIALSEACTSLRLVDKADDLEEQLVVAIMIVELAKRGERDPDRLKAAVLKKFRH
jgi:hypothetical protein